MGYMLSGMLLSHEEERDSAVCDNTDGPWGCCAKSDREMSTMWLYLSEQSKKAKPIETESRLVVTRLGGVGTGEMLVKMHKLEVRKQIPSGDLRHSLVMIISNTALYSLKSLEDSILNILTEKRKIQNQKKVLKSMIKTSTLRNLKRERAN